MSHRYAPNYKASVLNTLDAHRGNVVMTSRKTGVPERTVRAWRAQRAAAAAANQSSWQQRQRRQQEQPSVLPSAANGAATAATNPDLDGETEPYNPPFKSPTYYLMHEARMQALKLMDLCKTDEAAQHALTFYTLVERVEQLVQAAYANRRNPLPDDDYDEEDEDDEDDEDWDA